MEAASLEIWALDGIRRLELTGGKLTIGTGGANDLRLEDPTVSRLHASLEDFGDGWCVTDLGSSNGTFVNGDRIWSARRLRHNDEVRAGRTRLIFRSTADATAPRTEAEDGPPRLTGRERDVLVVLCRPLLDRDLFTEPASIKEIAGELFISEAAVKQHLANLFDKFDVPSDVSQRRTRLANAAIRRGAVTLADLRGPTT